MAIIEKGISRSLIYDIVNFDIVQDALTYFDRSANYQLNMHKRAKWKRKQMGDEAYYAELEELSKKLYVSLLIYTKFSDKFIIPTGLISLVEDKLRVVGESVKVIDRRKEPEETWGYRVNQKNIPNLRYYQQEALDACLKNKQGTVVAATGTGKTVIIQELIRDLGLNTLLVTPSISIAEQTARRFANYFDKHMVGVYGDGKKHVNKITIGVCDSIANADPSTFDEVDVVIMDEAHHVAASTLQKIAYEIVPKAYYRFGFTATPERADGADLAVVGTVFPSIYEYPINKAIEDGFLARPTFKMLDVISTNKYDGNNPNQAYKNHILNNQFLNDTIKKIAEEEMNKDQTVLILVNETAHGRLLWESIDDSTFVHGDGTSCKMGREAFCSECDETKKIEYHKDKKIYECPDCESKLKVSTKEVSIRCEHAGTKSSEVQELFNAGNIKCLIGTSVIGEGTDLIPVDVLIKANSGATKGLVMQNIGRGLRISPTKDSVTIYDFDFPFHKNLHRHGTFRNNLYNKITGDLIEYSVNYKLDLIKK